MVIYVCPTCQNKYEASITGNRISYMSENKLIVLQNENDDCHNCNQEIKQSIEAKRAEIKAKKQQI